MTTLSNDKSFGIKIVAILKYSPQIGINVEGNNEDYFSPIGDISFRKIPVIITLYTVHTLLSLPTNHTICMVATRDKPFEHWIIIGALKQLTNKKRNPARKLKKCRLTHSLTPHLIF